MGKAWVGENGDVAHPNAPRGGGGPGAFRSADPLGSDVDWSSRLPDPRSPVARYLALNDKQKKAAKQLRFSPLPSLRKEDAAINARIKSEANSLVTRPVIGSGECYDLADSLLTNAGARSAPDFGKITPTADYKWGSKIALSDVQEGDILQFAEHKITIVTAKKTKRTAANGSWREQTEIETETHVRPHHTAVVSSVDGDGALTIVEQHVKDPATGKLSHVVRKNRLYTRSLKPTVVKRSYRQGDVSIDEQTTATITVSGTISAYRPQPR